MIGRYGCVTVMLLRYDAAMSTTEAAILCGIAALGCLTGVIPWWLGIIAIGVVIAVYLATEKET